MDPSTKRKRRKLLKKCNRMFSDNTLAQPMTRLMSEIICSSNNLLKEDQIEATPIDYSKKDIFNYNSEGNVSDTSSDQLTDSSLSVSDIDISTDGENDNVANVSKSLKDFGIETGQSYANMKVLFEKMITHHPELPGDPRTLFNISKKAISPNLRDVFPGKYYHFGIQNGLCQLIPILKQASLIGENNVFKLNIGIDGLPLFKSTLLDFGLLLLQLIRSVIQYF
ncbi:uncharacterized protein LOC136075110 isoform X2 [Hydra vulgaris]|uniref:Uncharacterized protein LOC136075110 isoform X2 n=1 Tax=Hydra vulgaris TaxID=6087 RepID=A0ABM4B3T4_HYDVU